MPEQDRPVSNQPCACTELQREHGHRYDCIYGPLRYLPARIVDEPLPPTPPTQLLIVGEPMRKSGWRLFRAVQPLWPTTHAADELRNG
jgi:hypothetical protein